LVLGRLRRLVNEVAPSTIGRALHRAGVTPNEITYAGLALSVLAPLVVWLRALYLLPVIILLAGLMDVLDGAVARAANRTTPFGSYLDSVTDRVSDVLLFLAMAMAGVNQYITMVALAFSLIVSYSRAKGELLNVKMEGIGVAERGDRLIILFIMSILLLFRLRLVNDALMALIATLAAVTVVQRSLRVSRALAK
jgi:archaetidylinositol phosphate synthase